MPNILKVTPRSKCPHTDIFEHNFRVIAATVAKRQSRSSYTQNPIWNSVYHINLSIFLFSTGRLSLKSACWTEPYRPTFASERDWTAMWVQQENQAPKNPRMLKRQRKLYSVNMFVTVDLIFQYRLAKKKSLQGVSGVKNSTNVQCNNNNGKRKGTDHQKPKMIHGNAKNNKWYN